MKTCKRILISVLFSISFSAMAQDDLLKMLEAETQPDKPDYTSATFKTTRLINGHSVENVAGGVMDFRISHRFGFLNSGAYEFFGLDQAFMRLGLDYGVTDRIMVGVGRSNYQKQLDGFTKIKILRQSSGIKTMPVTLSYLVSVIYKTEKFSDPIRDNFRTSKINYAHQLIVGRKFNENISFQIMPTVVHYNMVPDSSYPNDLLSIGAGGRVKITKRVSINGEYYYQLPGYEIPGTYNSVSLGFDIETGGHVFQLYFTNSTGMTDRTFINETTGDLLKGDIHFGFNVSRVFTIRNPRR